MNIVVIWLDSNKRKRYGQIVNIIDGTLTVKDLNTGEETTFYYKDDNTIYH